MALWDDVRRRMALAPWDHPKAEHALERPERRELSTDPQGGRITAERALLAARQAYTRPWRAPSVDDALGVPAIFEAVQLVSNMLGIFTLEAFQNGRRVADVDRPRLVVRPNPFTTLRDYLRETGWSMATRGENWQWVGARDADGRALSLIPVPSREVEAGGDWLVPTVKWRGTDKTRDMVAVYLTKELGAVRGRGPLQYCGAAISAAVESQEWAANYYASGGNPAVVLKSELELDEQEAIDLKTAWTATPPNMPQVVSSTIDVKDIPRNESAAQALESRNWNAGEAARMYAIPGPLLEYARGGASLTYANVVALMDQLLRQCLIPNYLEPLEQMISDQLARTWTTRFNVDAILRADIKTRFEVYESGLRSGVYLDPSEPRAIEGLESGGQEVAPVPFAAPSAFPSAIPTRQFGGEWRCPACNRKLAEVRGTGTQARCRCGTLAVA